MPQLKDSNGEVIPGQFPVGVLQSVSYDSSTPSTNAVTAGTRLVQIITTTAAYVATGAAPTATSANLLVPALTPTVIPVADGDKVAALKLASAGVMVVREIS